MFYLVKMKYQDLENSTQKQTVNITKRFHP